MATRTIDRPAIETPEEYFGFPMGTDRRLVRWPSMLRYFRALAADSDRLRYEELGVIDGQPLVLLTISDPENLRREGELRDVQSRLADPRKILDAADRQRLLQTGRCVCLITCSIHATEVGGVQMTPDLVHRLVTGEDQETRRILSEVVLLLVPSLNPYGMELVADWYKRMLGTPYEGTPPPQLYHRFAGHDNNRDWFMQALPETRLVVEHIHNSWWPHIVYDLHQMQPNGPRYVVPPFVDPYDPNVDPLLQAEINQMGATIAAELTAEGKTGVATTIIFDAYSPSRAYQLYHGGVRILSEAASVRIATPISLTADQLAETRGFEPRLSTQNHPLPWPGGAWTLRDIVDYNRITSWTVLDHAARYRDRWVRNFARVQARSLGRSTPYAYVVPPAPMQRDSGTALEMLRILQAGAVEVEQAEQGFTADGVDFPKGSFVVRMGQPFGGFAKTLLEAQRYPDLQLYPGGPPKPPYDITAHTLPLQMGVSAVRVGAPFVAALRRIPAVPLPEGGVVEVDGRGSSILIGSETNAGARLVNELLGAGAQVGRATMAVTVGDHPLDPGAFVVTGVRPALVDQVARNIGCRGYAASIPNSVEVQRLPRPRIAVYHSWRPHAIDAGWTRYVLEEYRFPHTVLRDRDIRQGNLRSRFDAIVLPQEGAKQILEGNSPTEYPPEYAGGIGDHGAANLRRFVEDGGTLITLDAASDVAIRHLYLPVTNVLDGVRHEEFYSPGSLLRILIDPLHPVGWGFEREAAAMFVSSPAFDIRDTTGVDTRVVARYPLSNQLLSGWIRGAERISGRAAVVDVAVGRGRVILIGLRPQFRAQARGTYRLLFNALYASTLQS